MLKRRRLLVLSGQSGAGTTSAAQGIRDGLVGCGVAARVVDGRGREAEIEALVDRAIASAGLGTLAHELPGTLMRLEGLAGILAVREAAARGGAILWDAGETGGFLRLMTLLSSTRSGIAGILPPLAAMRAAQSLSEDDLAAWQMILDAIDAVQALLAGEDSRILLVVVPDEGLDDLVATRIGQLSLVRAGCDGILVNRVPRTGEGWPESWAEPRRRRVESLRGRGLPVIEIPLLVDDAPGAGAFQAAAGEVFDSCRLPRPLPDSIEERDDGGYDLHAHLPGVRPDLVRAGRLGDTLVTEVSGLRRQTALAPVLARCEIEGAGMDGDRLVVRFGRNRALWPEAS